MSLSIRKMTESSSDKTRRKFAALYRAHDWRFQTTVFITLYPEKENFLAIARSVRKVLVNDYPDTAFLWKIILSKAKPEYLLDYNGKERAVVMPALTLFHFKRISREELSDSIISELKYLAYGDLYIKGRSLPSKIYHAIHRRFKEGTPPDLKLYFNKDRAPESFGLLSADYALKWDDSSTKEKSLE
jgi:hypothetical protein